ncbi:MULTISPECIES: hypothetical protein [unclassified Thermococcus]|uniref:hypothetical protein n=1 Tax=unclassified Thermococcus TaxID=2627626 RepID=UPI001F0E7792|nr:MULTISPECIES: hypothetical protein [unclassified Thermococcus]
MKDAKSLAFPISAVTIAIGGFLAQFYGFKVPLILGILINAVGIIVIASIPEYEFKKLEVPYHLHVLHSFRELLKPNIFWLIMVSIFVGMSINQFRKFFEPYLAEILASSLKTTMMRTLGILGIVEALVKSIPKIVGVRLKEEWSKIAYSLAPVTIPMLTALSVVLPNPAFIVALGIIATVVNTAYSFNFGIELQTRIPSEKRATILSLNSMLAALIMATFYAIYGIVVDKLTLPKARLLFALMLLVVGVIVKALERMEILKEALNLKHLG